MALDKTREEIQAIVKDMTPEQINNLRAYEAYPMMVSERKANGQLIWSDIAEFVTGHAPENYRKEPWKPPHVAEEDKEDPEVAAGVAELFGTKVRDPLEFNTDVPQVEDVRVLHR